MRRALNGLDMKKVEGKEWKCKHFSSMSPKRRACVCSIPCIAESLANIWILNVKRNYIEYAILCPFIQCYIYLFLNFYQVMLIMSYNVQTTNLTFVGKKMSQARSYLHSVGPHPSHVSFTARSSYPHMRGNSSPSGTNVTIPNHLYLEAPLACEENLSIDVNLNICNGIVTLVPNKKEFPHMCGQENRAVKEAWEGEGIDPTEGRCDLARGKKKYIL